MQTLYNAKTYYLQTMRHHAARTVAIIAIVCTTLLTSGCSASWYNNLPHISGQDTPTTIADCDASIITATELSKSANTTKIFNNNNVSQVSQSTAAAYQQLLQALAWKQAAMSCTNTKLSNAIVQTAYYLWQAQRTTAATPATSLNEAAERVNLAIMHGNIQTITPKTTQQTYKIILQTLQQPHDGLTNQSTRNTTATDDSLHDDDNVAHSGEITTLRSNASTANSQDDTHNNYAGERSTISMLATPVLADITAMQQAHATSLRHIAASQATTEHLNELSFDTRTALTTINDTARAAYTTLAAKRNANVLYQALAADYENRASLLAGNTKTRNATKDDDTRYKLYQDEQSQIFSKEHLASDRITVAGQQVSLSAGIMLNTTLQTLHTLSQDSSFTKVHDQAQIWIVNNAISDVLRCFEMGIDDTATVDVFFSNTAPHSK